MPRVKPCNWAINKSIRHRRRAYLEEKWSQTKWTSKWTTVLSWLYKYKSIVESANFPEAVTDAIFPSGGRGRKCLVSTKQYETWIEAITTRCANSDPVDRKGIWDLLPVGVGRSSRYHVETILCTKMDLSSNVATTTKARTRSHHSIDNALCLAAVNYAMAEADPTKPESAIGLVGPNSMFNTDDSTFVIGNAAEARSGCDGWCLYCLFYYSLAWCC